MSTSVYKPLGMRFPAKTSEKLAGGPFYKTEVQKVKRVLFGPVDHAKTQKFIEEELEKIAVVQSEIWNFDFKREQTLDPNGTYDWRPATPQKSHGTPVKRRSPRGQQFNAVDLLYGRPVDVIRPTTTTTSTSPVKDEEMKSPSSNKQQKRKQKSPQQQPQRLITDFMPVKKRSSSEYVKKDWPSTVERPAKRPRVSEMS